MNNKHYTKKIKYKNLKECGNDRNCLKESVSNILEKLEIFISIMIYDRHFSMHYLFSFSTGSGSLCLVRADKN